MKSYHFRIFFSELVKVAFIQKVRFVSQISQPPKKYIPIYYPELEIWICCLLLLAGNLNFKFRIVIWKTFLEIWRFKKHIALSEKRPPLGLKNSNVTSKRISFQCARLFQIQHTLYCRFIRTEPQLALKWQFSEMCGNQILLDFFFQKQSTLHKNHSEFFSYFFVSYFVKTNVQPELNKQKLCAYISAIQCKMHF